ncbi:MAG: sensor histidine kinase, partial [Bacteroidales bacterium]
SGWANKQMVGDAAIFQQIERSVARLNKQLLFIDQHGDELKMIMREGNSRNQPHNENGIRIETSSSGQLPQFFIFREAPEYCAGFLIDQNNFFDSLAHAVFQEDFAFAYIIKSGSGDNSSISSNNLVYSFQLNPLFPEQTLQIYPQNEDLIEDLVKRRSWIYGVATFLLLMAMLLGIILIQRDIAREKNLATLRSDFISNVTHELKTPLTSIRMYAESIMMRRIKSNRDQLKYLSVIVNESERLKRMINNILEFSKMEKTGQEVHPVESNLSEILYSAIQDMYYWLDKEGFTLTKEIEEGIKAKVDPDKLHQVYTNLLNNAIKYSGDSRHIYVRLFQNHLSVVTEVEDEGIGISKEDRLKIFDEFFRVENHESGNITGTGLGLTVVREIVVAHHGEIKVESEIGKGSKFSVILFKRSMHENHPDHRR